MNKEKFNSLREELSGLNQVKKIIIVKDLLSDNSRAFDYIRERVLGLDRNKKLKIVKSLLNDLGSPYITIHNLSKILKISETTTRRCFKVFDKRVGLMVMPGFINYPEFKELWEDRHIDKNPQQLLDLLAKANKFVKAPEGSGDEEFSYIKSKLYSAKTNILWQLRHLVKEVAIEKPENSEACFAIILQTGHQFHQPIRTAIEPKYWKSLVREERPYNHPENTVELKKDDFKYYRAVADLLFYLQRRGLEFKYWNDEQNNLLSE